MMNMLTNNACDGGEEVEFYVSFYVKSLLGLRLMKCGIIKTLLTRIIMAKNRSVMLPVSTNSTAAITARSRDWKA